MKKNSAFAALVMLLFMLCSVLAWSQNTAQIEGKVTDGKNPIPNAQITFTNIDNNRVIKLKADKNGNFAALGIPFGVYNIDIASATGDKLYGEQRRIQTPESGGPAQLTIDTSKQSGQSGGGGNISAGGSAGSAGGQTYTKDQIAEMQKQREKATNINALIAQATTAMNAKNWEAALPITQQLVAAEPTNWQFYQALGNTQFNLGHFEEAADAYLKGVQAAESNTTVDPKNPATDPVRKKTGMAQMLTNEGNADLKLHKNKEAVDAFTKAASLDPNPGTAYFNLCATQYNSGNVEGGLEACDKAIAADPTKADAYFIKGSLMVGESKIDSSGKMTPPPGTSETLNKYLELAPDGPHATDVKQMLAAIGSKVETTYKKGKGK
jgi:tetratricopeptide (TPR) repeat protein